MGYVLDLTVILGNILRTTADNVSANDAQLAMDQHVNSGRRDEIHQEIRHFVTESFATGLQGDHILAKIAIGPYNPRAMRFRKLEASTI